jgi:hypothetical protein
MNNVEIITWENYKTWVSELAKRNLFCICRGQASDIWKLQTSFHRISSIINMSIDDYLKKVIPELHFYVCAQTNEIMDLKVPDIFGSFLALLQHHGFPTPLLDWTLSPYIAVYFAFRDVNDVNPQSDYIKLFLFDNISWTSTFSQPLDLRDNSVRYVSILHAYAKYNPRLIPQQSIFTVTNVDDMEEYISKRSEESGHNFLFTARMSVKEKPHVMRELSLMGINEMTLFPSVEGICRAMKAKFFAQDSIGLTPTELIEYLKSKLSDEAQDKLFTS